MSSRTERARDLPRSVFVHEILDPSGRSLTWLEEQGVRVVRGEETWAASHLDEDALIERGRGHVALMGASTNPITRRVIEELPDLAFISKYGIGVDSIDMAAAEEHGVLVTNTPVPENIEAVAEYTVAAMLALRKQLLFYTTERMREGGWRTPDAWGDFVWRKTVGYVGFGRIARAVARRLQGWDTTTLVYDPYIEVQEPGVRQTSLEELLAESDVITLHAVASTANRHLIDEAALSLVKPSAVIVNSARGSLMDLDAVHRAMLGGRLAGVALDAYEHEPPEIDHPLFLLPNVLATPHASAWVRETFQRISDCGAENLAAALRGDVPDNAVNPQVLG
ncbi:phosphoglycerate dehydrogenase [Nocardioides agariphilus]|jgi:phosphoglycerate dehydrogenase-like enzyme|uniref:Phosphoglycerate dehydrogenase n=1 Tax=Nocardioides agariphilus TaxID=433664 RepID=A0A930YGN3_9ACTN|nr:NAD(P)-dependent oxidoreductase [Nocardioides agariphilus]MBF4766212.1 phosphoglycerate dehydrogenase [Nocardioides agariphilus]